MVRAANGNPKNKQNAAEILSPKALVSFSCLALNFLLLFGLTSSVGSQQAAPQRSPSTVRVTILYLSDVHQFTAVDNGKRGSLARVSTLVKLIKKESPNTVFVLAGNTISPSVESRTYEGRQMIDAWNAAGLDLAVIGNQEFDFGPKVLQQRIEESRFVWLGANVLQGKDVFGGAFGDFGASFGGVKIAFLGLLGAKSLANPGGGVNFRSPDEVARERIAVARTSGAKIFIALTNMSLEEDKDLARNVPELAAIIGGRSQTVTRALAGRTPIFKTSAEARELGRLDLNIDTLRGEVESIDSTFIPVTSEIPEASQFAVLYAKYATPNGQTGSHCGDGPPTNPSRCDINQQFNLGCDLPFPGGESREIDLRCPNEGCSLRDSDKVQNRIKNNLCAKGTPVQISMGSIDRLQAAVDRVVAQGQISYGSNGPPQPADRAKLQALPTVDVSGQAVTLGEGKLVSLDAFVLEAKHDDTFPFGFAGESVNCKNSLLEWNDIHVTLGETESASECASVTAEIIPHFRPAVWERFDSNACTSSHVLNPLPVKGLRVRITGQLFFDGSHKPTPCATPSAAGNPLRRSVWEIHPVYAIEVFDKTEKRFIRLDQWAKQPLTFSARQVGDVTILDLDGRITIGESSSALRAALRRLFQEGKKKILLNFANVSDIDDTGIGELVSSYTSIDKGGGQLKLLNVSEKLKDLLTITKLLAVFDVYNNEKEALASFK